MGMWNEDEVEGKLDKAKGDIKKGVGHATNDPEMVQEGDADRAKGNIKEGFGKARRGIGEAIEDIGDSIKR
jgi:uncharacterized protein YjbJ (UPF0337 family)